MRLVAPVLALVALYERLEVPLAGYGVTSVVDVVFLFSEFFLEVLQHLRLLVQPLEHRLPKFTLWVCLCIQVQDPGIRNLRAQLRGHESPVIDQALARELCVFVQRFLPIEVVIGQRLLEIAHAGLVVGQDLALRCT